MHLVELTLRHDVPETDWAWGSGMSYALAARDYRLTEVGRLWEGLVWAYLYLEHKDVLGLTVRATVNNPRRGQPVGPDRLCRLPDRADRLPRESRPRHRPDLLVPGPGKVERLHGKERSHENPPHGHGACPSVSCAGGGADGCPFLG